PGEIRRQSPDLPAAYPELRRAAGAVLVQRSQDQATAGGRGLGADLHRSDGPTYSTERVPSHALLWAACDVQSQEGEGVAHHVDGGTGSADQGDVIALRRGRPPVIACWPVRGGIRCDVRVAAGR